MIYLNQEQIKEESKKNKTSFKLIVGIVIIVVILIGLISVVILVQRRTFIIGKAYGPTDTNRIELENSYIFASPLKAAKSGEKIRITVFVLDSQGKGVEGKKVDLGNPLEINIDNIQEKTDELGRAIFDISSNKAALYQIEASVEGKELPQRVSITFQ